MSEFDGHEFAAGSLTGIRTFELGKDGWLKAPLIGMRFEPGENVARCLNAEPLLGAVHGWVSFARLARGSYGVPPAHRVAGRYCSCGFYAYYDGPEKNMYSAGTNRVRAIVEGYGLCTYGTRGFRAEKLRLIGLVRQSQRLGAPAKWMRRFLIGAIILCGLTAGASAVRGDWFGAAFNALLVAINTWGLRGNPLPTRTTLTWRKVRRNYPGVPIYRTVEQALEAHPLTTPERSEVSA